MPEVKTRVEYIECHERDIKLDELRNESDFPSLVTKDNDISLADKSLSADLGVRCK